jgi:pSer/pThr/pTyr-binding forkhead associated (FHA) protein
MEGRMPAKLTIIRGLHHDQSHRLEDGEAVVIGRATHCDIRVPDGRSSRKHCRVEYVDGHWVLTDLKSMNGTLLNNQPVDEARLTSGDQIRVGHTVYEFAVDGEPVLKPDHTGALINDDAAKPEPDPPRVMPPTLEDDSAPVLTPDDDRQGASNDAPRESIKDDPNVCAQCGRAVPSGAVEQGEATEIAGRVYCSRCVVHHADRAEEKRESQTDDSSEFSSLLKSLERAAQADRIEASPPPANEPPPKPKRGLFGRLRGKSDDG